MNDERYILSNWQSKDIEVTSKTGVLQKLIQDVILNLRRVLIDLKVKELMEEASNEKTLQEAMDYTQLKKFLFEKLYRVWSS